MTHLGGSITITFNFFNVFKVINQFENDTLHGNLHPEKLEF